MGNLWEGAHKNSCLDTMGGLWWICRRTWARYDITDTPETQDRSFFCWKMAELEDVADKRDSDGTVSYSLEEITRHTSEGDAWLVHSGKVYDVSGFLERHPGGQDILLRNCGKDVTETMNSADYHKHSKIAYGWLQKYCIGKVKEEEKKDIDENDLDNICVDGWREDMVDWNKPMLAQVGKLGPNYLKWVHSPVDRPLRLFYSDFMEFFSRTPWFFVPIIWIPVVIYTSVLAIKHLNKAFTSSSETRSFPVVLSIFCSLFLVGCLLWSLIEYVLHRFLFHLLPPPDSPFWITFHFFLHGQHHKVPFDGARLVFPPVAASVFAFGFYTLFNCLMSSGYAHSIFSGGLLGYVFYDCIHYYLHHGSPTPGGYFHNLKKYHVKHHFEDQQMGFGISSKLWDYPFHTHPDKEKSS